MIGQLISEKLSEAMKKYTSIQDQAKLAGDGISSSTLRNIKYRLTPVRNTSSNRFLSLLEIAKETAEKEKKEAIEAKMLIAEAIEELKKEIA